MKKLLIICLCLSAMALPACVQDAELNNTGTLSLRITDAPTDADNIAGVYVTIEKVEYKKEDAWQEFEGFEGPKKINLLELTEGKTAILGDFIVGAGRYSNLRFHLSASASALPEAEQSAYIKFKDGSITPLYIPSGNQSGYKALGDFEVPVNGTVFITADFDVRKSVVQSGSSGKWILKPVIRLMVNDQAGNIAGTAQGLQEDLQYLVYAYAAGAFTEGEAFMPAEGQVQFPAAVSSTKIHEAGDYFLSFLAPGTYDLVVAAYENTRFVAVVGKAENVNVQPLQTTQLKINF